MCFDCVHNYRQQETQISREECCYNRLAKIRKQHGYRRIETSLEQCKCCSRCCSNAGALTEKIPREILRKLKSEISKSGRCAP